jgi:flagellar basal-body rod protein FlgC
MDPILPIAFPGVVAATRRRRVSTDNVVGTDSDGPPSSASATDEARDTAADTAEPADQVMLSSRDTEAVITHDPMAPYADANGLVAQPDVDLVEETVEQQLTSRTDSALSVRVTRVYSQMQKALLDIEA